MSIGEINSDKNATSNISSSKYSIKDIQEKVKLLLLNARIFDKALKSLTGKKRFLKIFNLFEFFLKLILDSKLQDIITKHLAKTCLTEIFNEILKFTATDQLISFNEEALNADVKFE